MQAYYVYPLIIYQIYKKLDFYDSEAKIHASKIIPRVFMVPER